ncbi:MAG: hypothetical protein H6772_01820 [Pseudomonadales bacterium]|nr:hypothetical protein [Pseudomonadales bacterium]
MSNYEFFSYQGKIAMISTKSGSRLEFDEKNYLNAKESATKEFPDRPNIIKTRIMQILSPDELSVSDKINLCAAELFPSINDIQYFGLTVRFLSTDMPSAKLSNVEESILSEVLEERGTTLQTLSLKSAKLFQ